MKIKLPRYLIVFIFGILYVGLPNLFAQSNETTHSTHLSQHLCELMVEDAFKRDNLEDLHFFLESCLKTYPGNAKLWDYQALMLLQQKKYEQSIEAANRALKLFPTPTRHINLGWIHHSAKQYSIAIKHYKLGANAASKFKAFYFHLADCFERTGQKEEAIKYYQQYLKNGPAGTLDTEAKKRLEILQNPAMSGVNGMTAAQRRAGNAMCNEKYPGLVVDRFDPITKKVTCGCPDGAVYTGKGCLCKLELEIMRAINAMDIDRAEQLAARADQQPCKFNSNVLEDLKFIVKIKKTTPWMLNKKSFDEEMKKRDRAFNDAMAEWDEERRRSDELWGRISRETFEKQMQVINDTIARMDSPMSHIVFDKKKKKEIGDSINLMNTPVPDQQEAEFGRPGEENSYIATETPDKIQGVWQGSYRAECPAPKHYIGPEAKFTYLLEIRHQGDIYIGRILAPSKTEEYCPEVHHDHVHGCVIGDVCFEFRYKERVRYEKNKLKFDGRQKEWRVKNKKYFNPKWRKMKLAVYYHMEIDRLSFGDYHFFKRVGK